MVQPQCKTVWRFRKQLAKELPRDTAIAGLGMYPKEMKTGCGLDIGTPTFITASFTTRSGNNLSAHGWVNGYDVVYIHQGSCLNANSDAGDSLGARALHF